MLLVSSPLFAGSSSKKQLEKAPTERHRINSLMFNQGTPAKDQHVLNLINMWNVKLMSHLTINHKLMGSYFYENLYRS